MTPALCKECFAKGLRLIPWLVVKEGDDRGICADVGFALIAFPPHERLLIDAHLTRCVDASEPQFEASPLEPRAQAIA